jgi:peptide/nickel transport system permease protein
VLSFVARRAIGLVVSTLLVISITFLLMQMIPGDPASVMLGSNATPEQIERLRDTWGLNDPIYVQFVQYFVNFLRGNLGESLFHRRPVLEIIGQRAETSLWLGLGALIVVVGLGIPAGVLASIRPNGFTDNTMLLVALAGASIPSFWLGLMLMTLFAGRLGWLPSSGFTSVIETGNLANLKNLILPAFSLGFVNAALVARTARSSMLDVLQADFVTTARAKGLREWGVIMKHAFRNGAIPIVTVISFTFAALVSGAVVTENVFALPGVGSLIVQSVLKRDYPVIQGIMFIVALLYVIINFLTDLSYAMLDPRIRYR